MSGDAKRAGGCLCGGVRYTLTGALRDVIACHCGQCRRASGHHVASIRARRAGLTIESGETLARYESSPGFLRTFCARCGSKLFWESEGSPEIWVMAGTLDSPTGLKIAEHIYVADKGDYYEITDGLPQSPQTGTS